MAAMQTFEDRVRELRQNVRSYDIPSDVHAFIKAMEEYDKSSERREIAYKVDVMSGDDHVGYSKSRKYNAAKTKVEHLETALLNSTRYNSPELKEYILVKLGLKMSKEELAEHDARRKAYDALNPPASKKLSKNAGIILRPKKPVAADVNASSESEAAQPYMDMPQNIPEAAAAPSQDVRMSAPVAVAAAPMGMSQDVREPAAAASAVLPACTAQGCPCAGYKEYSFAGANVCRCLHGRRGHTKDFRGNPINFMQKYLKYKNKYLELKSRLE